MKGGGDRTYIIGEGEGDPEPEIGAEDTAELLGTEAGGGGRDAKGTGDVGIGGAGGEAEEADGKPGVG